MLAVLVVCGASLGLNQLFVGGTPAWVVANWPGAVDRIQDWRTTIFYQMPFRAFELGIGAVLVWVPALKINWMREVALAVGLALIGWCIVSYTEEMVFPAVNALPPCIGALLVLYGGQARALGWVLRNRVATGVGLVSYSLYLVHWPLIVFYQIWSERPLDTPEKIAILVLSICMAALMFRFVESPFRHRRAHSGGAWKWAIAAVVPMALLTPIAAHATGGMLWRMPRVMAVAVHGALEEFEHRGAHFRSGRCFMSGVEGDFYAEFDFKRCIEPEPSKRNLLLVGDSIAAYAYGAMQKEAEANGATVLQFTLTGCRITLEASGPCASRNRMVLSEPQRFAGQEIVLMGAWGIEDVEPLKAVIATLRGAGLDVTVVGAPIVFKRPLPDMFATSIDLEESTAVAISEMMGDTFDIDRAIRAASTAAGAEYFSVVERACPQMTFDSCHVMINGSLIAFDQVHMTHQFGLAAFDGAAFLQP